MIDAGPGTAAPHPRQVFAALIKTPTMSGSVERDMVALLTANGCPGTAAHCIQVAHEAARIATHFGLNANAARTAGLLHDVSAVFPNGQRLQVAESLGLTIHAAERTAPMLLHQRISACMARDLFNVADADTLAAIACHTTLKAGATVLCKALFVADKIAWDQPGTPPWLADIQAALALSLDAACRVYLRWLWSRRETLAAVHPWFVAAHAELCGGEAHAP